MKSNLVLHCGASRVDRGQLVAVATPRRTRSWVPVPHDRLLSEVEGTLTRNGLTVVSEAHGLTRDGLRYFGLLQVANGHSAKDFGVVVGIRNSHDKSFPAGLVLGSSVFVCDNLAFSGGVKLARKHTSHIERDLPQLTDIAVGHLVGLRETQAQRFSAYKQHEITDREAHDLVIQALDARAIPVTKIPDVLTEWRAPRHLEFREGGRTAWRLFNAVTECLKGSLDALPRRTQALHGLLDAACGLATQPQVAMAV